MPPIGAYNNPNNQHNPEQQQQQQQQQRQQQQQQQQRRVRLNPAFMIFMLLMLSVPLQLLIEMQEEQLEQRLQNRHHNQHKEEPLTPPPTSSSTTSTSKKPLSRFKKYLLSWYQWYSDFEEWLDEVLPPADITMLVSSLIEIQYYNLNKFWLCFQDDYYYEDDEDEGGPVQFQLDLGQGMTLSNLTEEWFGSSRKPRRIRPKNVRINKMFVSFMA